MHSLAGLQTSHPEEIISYSGSDITDKLFLNLWVSRYSESNVYLPAGLCACKAWTILGLLPPFIIK